MSTRRLEESSGRPARQGHGIVHTPCARHDESAAGYQCSDCGELLCRKCVQLHGSLIACRLCGQRAFELDELERAAVRTDPVPRSARRDGAGLHTHAGVFLINHAVVPAAIIAMVSAVLFFLLDVRSVFLLGTEALKWIGFWFVVATVFIARYGRASSDAERQGCYTFALAAATLVAMTISPAANPGRGLAGPLVNLLIVFAVWQFATRLTRGLSLEGSVVEQPAPRVHGLDELWLQDWRRKHGREAAPEGEGAEPAAPAGAAANPAASVARLALGALAAFALGEPFLLAGPPAVSERALGAMIVFMLAAGVVLAASSGLGTWRRVRELGGEASLGILPGRLATAGALMVSLLALALAVPWFEYRGSGTLRPPAPESGAEGGNDRGASDEGGGAEDSANPREGGEAEAAGGERQSETRKGDSRGFSRAATSVVDLLAELGRWLRYLAAALAALLVLWGLWRFLPRLGSVRRWLAEGLRSLFSRFADGLRGLFRRRGGDRPADRADPFADLGSLRELEPRAAVLAAYHRWLLACELLGHERPERQTPYEFLASLPATLKPLAGPAGELTDVYVRAAYAEAAIGAADRSGAIGALETLKARLEPLSDS